MLRSLGHSWSFIVFTFPFLLGCDSAPHGDKDGPPKLSIKHSQPTGSQERGGGKSVTARYASLSSSKPRQVDHTPKRYRALLIGCTRYDDQRITPLRGPANDVELMRDVLIDNFKFRQNNSSIVVLSEKAGLEDLDLRPTRENIVRQFENLTQAGYEEDAQVVVLFSGHGGRMRDTSGDEIDGYDEVFCPADTKRLSGDGGVGSGGITDDEIHGWLQRISEHASVWLIADSCHNGTLTRGSESGGVDVSRTIEPPRAIQEEDHREELAQQSTRPPGVARATGEASRSTSNGSTKHSIVAFYAAPPTLETYDTEFAGVPHGLFTYSLCKVLRQAKGRLSYRQAILGVYAEYRKNRRESPTPQIEAINQDIEVLGHNKLRGSDIQLSRGKDGYSVTAGRLHDVTEGTILAVYSDDQTTGTEPHGYVRVVNAEMLKSQVEPCSYQDVQWSDPTKLPTEGFCKVASANFKGLRELAVAVDRETVSGQSLTDEARQRWETVVRGTNSEDKSLVKVVEHLHEADWIVQVADPSAGRIVYVSPTKRFRQRTDHHAGFVSPVDGDSDLWLQGMLNDIARSCNLVEVAEHELKRSSTQIDLDVQLRWKGVAGDYEQKVNQGPDLKIDDGSKLGVFIRNPNPFAVYVTVLFVNSKCQTKAWLPRDKHPNHRLEKTGKEGDDSFIPAKFTVRTDTTGLDRVVVIAVKERAQGQQPDLSFLASRTMERTRSKGQEPAPLEQLLAASVYGTTRGDAELDEDEENQLDEHTFRVLSWQTVKKDETGKGLFGGPEVGPPEDLGAKIVEAGNARYHTAGSSRAHLGTYGELVRGKVPQYEPYTQIAEPRRVRSIRTIDKVGRASGSALLSIAGHGRAWEILNLSGEVSGEHERHLRFEVVGTRLDQADVVDALNRDQRAMSYFSMLTKTDGVPVVILENITLPRFEATRRLGGSGKAGAQVSYTENGGRGRFEGERTSFVAFRSPVIRAYQMYEVRLAYVKYRDSQGITRTQLKVMKLDPIPPKRWCSTNSIPE